MEIAQKIIEIRAKLREGRGGGCKKRVKCLQMVLEPLTSEIIVCLTTTKSSDRTDRLDWKLPCIHRRAVSFHSVPGSRYASKKERARRTETKTFGVEKIARVRLLMAQWFRFGILWEFSRSSAGSVAVKNHLIDCARSMRSRWGVFFRILSKIEA